MYLFIWNAYLTQHPVFHLASLSLRRLHLSKNLMDKWDLELAKRRRLILLIGDPWKGLQTNAQNKAQRIFRLLRAWSLHSQRMWGWKKCRTWTWKWSDQEREHCDYSVIHSEFTSPELAWRRVEERTGRLGRFLSLCGSERGHLRNPQI